MPPRRPPRLSLPARPARTAVFFHDTSVVPRTLYTLAMPITSLVRPVLVAAALAIHLLLAGCTPTVNVNLGAGDGTLREGVVLADRQPDGSKIVAIDVTGLIADMRRPTLLGPGVNPVDQFFARLAMAENDPAVKAVILRINSPGGTVSASDTMYREVRRFREKTGKPVVASMGEIAASGGYFVALSADEIVAQPTSITASIGVIIPTMNFSDGLSRIGIVARSVKSGKNKDLANPFEPMREGQYAVLQEMVDEYYASFCALVRERRPHIKQDAWSDATDGRVITGHRALEWGLVDREGGLRDAFERAKELAGIKSATLVKYADDGSKPRSPYSLADLPTAQGPEINLLQIRPGMAGADAASPTPGMAYYLWSPEF